MTNALFDAPFPEPSQLTGFAQNRLIRDSENRDESTLGQALNDPNCRFFIHSGSKVLVEEGKQQRALFNADEAKHWGAELEDGVLLGQDENEGGPRISVHAKIDEEKIKTPFLLHDHRSLLYASSVSEGEAGAIAQGGSLLSWINSHRFCGKCGSPTRTEIGGYRIGCPSCDHKVFPRTDPVVIMLSISEDGERCLMGRSPHFPEGWYSTLAGFIEPGETIEDAVRRETFEEAGIKVRRVRYHASQPWPFPHSLMIGVHCEAVSEKITIQDDELEDCRWFTKKEVRQMIADEHPLGFRRPPSRAIASTLISAWVE